MVTRWMTRRTFRYTEKALQGIWAWPRKSANPDHEINAKRLYLRTNHLKAGRGTCCKFRYINQLRQTNSSGKTRKVFTFLLEKIFRTFGPASKPKEEKRNHRRATNPGNSLQSKRRNQKLCALKSKGKMRSMHGSSTFLLKERSISWGPPCQWT